MMVLVACEESQRVCEAFRIRGHEAFSADIQEPSGGHPEWHILGDVLPIINGSCEFDTMDGAHHHIDKPWDLLIAHPPCTYLTTAGATLLFDHTTSENLGASGHAFGLLDCPFSFRPTFWKDTSHGLTREGTMGTRDGTRRFAPKPFGESPRRWLNNGDRKHQ